MNPIIRAQTEAEKDMTPQGTDGNTTGFISITGRRDTAEVVFKKQLIAQEQKSTKEGKPFARHAAMSDFKEHYDSEAIKSMRKNGYIKAEEIKPISLDWLKYSDLKNFKVIAEKEVPDENLTNRYKVPVRIKTKKYKFKGFEAYTYTVMEDGAFALQRALKEAKDIGK